MSRLSTATGYAQRRVFLVAVMALFAFGFAGAAVSAGSSSKPAAKSRTESTTKAVAAQETETGSISPDAERLFRAVVKVHTRAVPNARSAATLGDEREGSGV